MSYLSEPWFGGSKMNHSRYPGICLERGCVESGPRCEDGFCAGCCVNAHHEHQPPPKAGVYQPIEARLIARREVA